MRVLTVLLLLCLSAFAQTTVIKTNVYDTLTNGATPLKGTVTFFPVAADTIGVYSPTGIIVKGASTTVTLNAAGRYDVALWPSSSLAPESYYAAYYAPPNSTLRSFIGLYLIPVVSSSTPRPIAPYRVTDADKNLRFVFASELSIANLGGGTSYAPVPVLTAIAPNNADAGGDSFTLTVTGSNFARDSVVYFAGQPRTTSYVSTSSLVAYIGETDLYASGIASVTVFTPSPGGGFSAPQIFTINSMFGTSNPAPVLSSISPNSIVAGSNGFTLTLTGSSFIASSVVRWGGADRTTTVVNSTTLQAVINTADLASAGTVSVTVFNPSPGGGTSSGQTFTKTSAANPAPVLSSISPTSKTAGDATFTLTVNGSSFINGSIVRWNGVNRTTTYVSATQLTASIPNTDVASAGTTSVTVFTPSPGGGTSSGQTFTTNAPVGGGSNTYWVATNGTGTACSQGSPCALTTALNTANGTAIVGAGSTIYVKGGTYTLALPSSNTGGVPVTEVHLSGSSGSLITIMPAPGEYPIIRNGLNFPTASGQGYVKIKGIEFDCVLPTRFPQSNGVSVEAITIRQTGVEIEGNYIHDCHGGISKWGQAEGGRIVDNIIANNWNLNTESPGRPSGIAAYMQNGSAGANSSFPEMLLKNNVMYDNGVGPKAFASNGYVRNVTFERNISFNHGRPTEAYATTPAPNGVLSGTQRMPNLETGTDTYAAVNVKFLSNNTYHNGYGQNVMAGFANQSPTQLTVTNNNFVSNFAVGQGGSNHPLVEFSYWRDVIFTGNLVAHLQGTIWQNMLVLMRAGDTPSSANYTFNNNQYYTAFSHPFAYTNCSGCGANYTLTGWQGLGFDPTGSSVAAPTGVRSGFTASADGTFAYAYAYDFDASPAANLTLNLTGWLTAGNSYSVWYATNAGGFFNRTGALVSGTATGSSITVPKAMPAPHGDNGRFTVYLIRKS